MNRIAQVNNEVDFYGGTEPFNNLVKHYHNVIWSKMIICPCRKDITTQAVSNCINCNGIGFIWFDPKIIEGIILSMTIRKNYVQWTEDLKGTANFSTLAENRLGWYDKIVVQDGVSIFSESKILEEFEIIDDQNFKIARLLYPLIDVKQCFGFIDELTELIPLKIDVDFVLSENRKVLLFNEDFNCEKISILYTYNTTYIVEDVLNDWRSFRKGTQLTSDAEVGYKESDIIFDQYPLRVMLKKLHLVLQ